MISGRIVSVYVAIYVATLATTATAGDDDALVSTIGYKIEFADQEVRTGLTTPFASVLMSPDGSLLLTDGDGPLYGPPHWFNWMEADTWSVTLLQQYAGGYHCCHYYWVLSNETPYKIIELFNAGDTPGEIVDLDRDAVPELITLDRTFAYWYTSYAESPMPHLIWKVSTEGLTLARKLMKRFAHSTETLSNTAAEVRESYYEISDTHPDAWRGFRLDPRLWGTTAEIYYTTGSLKDARGFFDAAWPVEVPGAGAFWKELLDRLACSPVGIAGSECGAENRKSATRTQPSNKRTSVFVASTGRQ